MPLIASNEMSVALAVMPVLPSTCVEIAELNESTETVWLPLEKMRLLPVVTATSPKVDILPFNVIAPALAAKVKSCAVVPSILAKVDALVIVVVPTFVNVAGIATVVEVALIAAPPNVAPVPPVILKVPSAVTLPLKATVPLAANVSAWPPLVPPVTVVNPILPAAAVMLVELEVPFRVAAIALENESSV